MPTRPPFLFAGLEAIAEWLLAVIAMSLFLGISYNVAFFFGLKSEWLFFLSINDNVSASLHALPSAFFVVILFSSSATIFGSADGGSSRLPLFWLLTAFVIISIVLLPVEERRLPDNLTEWALAAAAVIVIPGIVPPVLFGILAVFAAMFDEPRQRLFAVGACGLVFLLATAAITARVDRELAGARSDVICTLSDQEPVRGKLVRTLSEGFILAKGGDWIWLPRSQVKKIAELSN